MEQEEKKKLGAIFQFSLNKKRSYFRFCTEEQEERQQLLKRMQANSANPILAKHLDRLLWRLGLLSIYRLYQDEAEKRMIAAWKWANLDKGGRPPIPKKCR